jgi:hypothetical protein
VTQVNGLADSSEGTNYVGAHIPEPFTALLLACGLVVAGIRSSRRASLTKLVMRLPLGFWG